MKKLFCLLAAVIFVFAACTPAEPSAVSSVPEPSSVPVSSEAAPVVPSVVEPVVSSVVEPSEAEPVASSVVEPSEAAPVVSSEAAPSDKVELGKLVILKPDDAMGLRGVRLTGGQHSGNSIHTFYIYEYIQFHIDCDYDPENDEWNWDFDDQTGGCMVYCVPHGEIKGSYTESERAFRLRFAEGIWPEPEGQYNLFDCVYDGEAGLYDLVFARNGVAVGYMVVELLPAIEE